MEQISIRKCIMVALICTGSLAASAQAGISYAYRALLQHTLDSLLEVKEVKGMSAAIYIPGKGIWQGVSGVSYGAHEIDTNMLFDIGSTTKSFVAAEIMKLIEEGYFSLDDSLSELLPPMEFVTPEITVRQLLQHKSGLAEYLGAAWEEAMFDDLTQMWYSPQAMDSFLTAPTGVPGGAWNYRNTNYVLLGMIAESFRGDSLHHILRDDFLTPLGLTNTYMEMFEPYDNEIADNWAAPDFDPDLAVNVSGYPHEALYSSTSFAGGFFSSAKDIATWGYHLYAGDVLSESSLEEMTDFTPVAGSYFTGYGFGCMQYSDAGNIYYGHAGNFFGYASTMMYDPVDSICLALLVNQDCLSPFIAFPLMRAALDNLELATVSVNSSDKNEFNLFPNPAFDHIQIQFPAAGNYNIEIYDLTGKLMNSLSVQSDVVMVNTSEFADGTYLVRVISGNESQTSRFMILRS